MSKKYLRQQRKFTPTLKKQIVNQIEKGDINVASASREYMVSATSIYKWIHQYSSYNKKGTIMVIDKKERSNQLQALQQRIAELERVVGHKQMQIDFYEKFIELAGEELGEDLKKKYSSTPSSGSAGINEDTDGR